MLNSPQCLCAQITKPSVSLFQQFIFIYLHTKSVWLSSLLDVVIIKYRKYYQQSVVGNYLCAVRKKKPTIILENILVQDYAAEGKSLSRIDGKVIFIENVIPGDVVDVQLVKNKKDWAEIIEDEDEFLTLWVQTKYYLETVHQVQFS